MSVRLDAAAILAAVAWPAGFVLVLWMYRTPLSSFLRATPGRLKSLTVAGFGVELLPVEPASLAGPSVTIDLSHQGTANDVNDSTLRSFYAQMDDPSRLDYAVVDLADGRAWLSSRLYILSIILHRMRGLRAIVFVQTVGLRKRCFVGVCDVAPVRWRLAARWPRLESAYAAAELRLWGHPYDERGDQIPALRALPGQQPTTISGFAATCHPEILNDEGRLPGHTASELLKSFLDANQRSAYPAKEGWQPLASADPTLAEYAEWLTGDMVETVMADSLTKRSVRLSDLMGWSDQVRLRAVVEQPGDWVAITRDDGVFERLIDRREVLEQLGGRALPPT
jgi:hypothetical protein